jgi:hypothetical protein
MPHAVTEDGALWENRDGLSFFERLSHPCESELVPAPTLNSYRAEPVEHPRE